MKYLFLLLFTFCINSSLPITARRMRLAILQGKASRVKKYLIEGESPVSVWPRSGVTPLMFALRWHQTAVAEILATTQFEEQAQLQNSSGQLPLHYAVSEGNLKIVTLLLALNFNKNHRDANGITPLHAAVRGIGINNNLQNIEIVKMLLAADVYPEDKDVNLWNAVLHTQNQELKNLLEPFFIMKKVE